MPDMIETSEGLPNTCANCGKPQEGTWFAASIDAARAGGGLCKTCARKEERAAPTADTPEQETARAEAEAEASASGPLGSESVRTPRHAPEPEDDAAAPKRTNRK
jgi:ribosome-binding protein aMBF1 (putative translation factor)